MAVRGGSWSIGGVRLPEFGITEAIQKVVAPSKPKTAQGGSNLFGSGLAQKSAPAVQGASTKAVVVPKGISSSYGGGGTYSSGGGSYAPATSGQSYDGGGGGDDGGGYDYLASLREAFGQQRSALEGMLPTYDADYANFKSQTEGGIQRAKDTLSAQNVEDERIFGQDLKKLLQSDNELRQRRQGLFSGLNALDSSAYQDETLKADQALLQDQQGLDAEKRRNYDARQREFTAYEQEATGKLNAYSQEIARAKQGIQQAIASANMDEAASISNYLSQLQSEAQQINAQREAMALNLAQLQAQGVNVLGNLSKLNMGAFSNLFGQNLAKRVNSTLSRYTSPTGAVSGSGYIGNSADDQQRRLLGLA